MGVYQKFGVFYFSPWYTNQEANRRGMIFLTGPRPCAGPLMSYNVKSIWNFWKFEYAQSSKKTLRKTPNNLDKGSHTSRTYLDLWLSRHHQLKAASENTAMYQNTPFNTYACFTDPLPKAREQKVKVKAKAMESRIRSHSSLFMVLSEDSWHLELHVRYYAFSFVSFNCVFVSTKTRYMSKNFAPFLNLNLKM